MALPAFLGLLASMAGSSKGSEIKDLGQFQLSAPPGNSLLKQDIGFYGHIKAGSWKSVPLKAEPSDCKVCPPDQIMPNKSVKSPLPMKGQPNR